MKKGMFHLSRLQRIQLKTLICILGICLILFLIGLKIIFTMVDEKTTGEKSKSEEQNIRLPSKQILRNVWIVADNEDCIVIYQEGKREEYSFVDRPDKENLSEQIADIVLSDGMVQEITVKHNKINGKILSANDLNVEIEEYGKIPLAKDYRGYRVYKTLEMCTAYDLPFGYDYADFCVEDGEICAIVLTKDETMQNIRVLIKGDDFFNIVHSEVKLSSDDGLRISYMRNSEMNEEVLNPDEILVIDSKDYPTGTERILVEPLAKSGKIHLKSIERAQGNPYYRGKLELIRTEDGIVIVNELLLEEYLYSVVPSEMPANYPMEALKAQAICARTYAYRYMHNAGYPEYGAHVDDSTAYQVYNNIIEMESTTTAVKETCGKLLCAGGKPADTYYYSTSCGVGSDCRVWKGQSDYNPPYLCAKYINQIGDGEFIDELSKEEKFKAFISECNENDYEVEEGWYRWRYHASDIDADCLLERLNDRYRANENLVLTKENEKFVCKPIGKLGYIVDIFVSGRGAGGIADEVIIEGTKGTYKIVSEYNIRYILSDGDACIQRQDGSVVNNMSLLPSAFIVIETGKEKGNVVEYTIIGGGYGHGVGMSQNAAKTMANMGMNAKEILGFFYRGCEIHG